VTLCHHPEHHEEWHQQENKLDDLRCFRGAILDEHGERRTSGQIDDRLKNEMRRGVQIVVSLLAIVLLVRPFDCFANVRTREAMACCLKGKCVPSANADDCCKNTVPAANHLLISKSAGWTPTLAFGVPFVSAPLPPSVDQIHVDLL
jgi:hypothetical protein